MNELIRRQFSVMRQSITDYRANHLGLNSLIQRIQGAGGVIDSDQWRDAIFPTILEMEQINADVLNAGTNLTEKDKSDLDKFLDDIEELIARFERESESGGDDQFNRAKDDT
jgi:hypothetical protein